MENLTLLQDKIRTFYLATQIPLCLITAATTKFSSPENIEYIPKIINSTFDISSYSILPYKENYHQPYSFFKNEYDECYSIFIINSTAKLIIGPIITSIISENQISNIIRENKFPIKLKSRLIKHYQQLPVIDSKRFYNLLRLLQYIFFETENKLLLPETDISPLEPEKYFSSSQYEKSDLFYHPPYFLEQELLSKIKVGDLSASIPILKEINSLRRTKLSPDTHRSIKNSLICSITLFTRAAIDGGLLPETAFSLSDYMILEIEKIDSLPKLVAFEYSALEQYIKLIKDINKKIYSPTIKKALSYISKNLTNKLTLGDISSAIFVHPNYLSSIFAKEIGVSLSDYIAKTRIDESKYYIKYTNTTISDVASFYHFCNQSYYTKAFKKFTGCTPKEYRNNFNYGGN